MDTSNYFELNTWWRNVVDRAAQRRHGRQMDVRIAADLSILVKESVNLRCNMGWPTFGLKGSSGARHQLDVDSLVHSLSAVALKG